MRKAFICPTKYVQGEDELLNLGYFVSTYGKTALLIAHPDDIALLVDVAGQIAWKDKYVLDSEAYIVVKPIKQNVVQYY